MNKNQIRLQPTRGVRNPNRARLLPLEIICVLLASASFSFGQQKYFTHWPQGYSPEEVGKRVAEHFVTSPHQDPQRIVYPEVCTWYGALTFAQLSGDRDLTAKLIERFEPLLSPPGSELIHHERHVDFSMFGSLPLEIYIETKDAKYLQLGKSLADTQWDPLPPQVQVREGMPPDTIAPGLTKETRFWVDDMYMITILQVQAFRATGEAKYLDRAALEMTAYLDKLQQPNGLFYHAPDVPFFWGRGDGWVAAGMSELLRSLPADHPKRSRIMDGYKKMMQSLVHFQEPDGMWHQLIDHPESFEETSSTGMFTFALITGVKNGWLDEDTYGPAARKAWIGLAGYVDQHANMTSICIGTGKKNELEYYLTRPRHTGDMHGQAPVLWSASALLR
ncbi:MAG: glycoside hydrolase family 88 protein [Acidobacteria bacterium]|nr:glycoside hydrolase family 88 protein [Acidobacteriota bacterium]